jgi:glycyl-tRNA synthetase
MKNEDKKMEDIVSLAKRRGFIFQGSEIYGGLAGTWDYGPYGVTLKNKVKKLWWEMFVEKRDDIYGVDAAILMNSKVWEASGHVGGFNDPLVDDVKTGKRYRADHLLEDAGVDPIGMSLEDMSAKIKEIGLKSPDGNELGEVRQFNMMFKTEIGASEDGTSVSYLRPETAGGIFVNFKNVLDSMHPKMPFGIAQIGKAFRNEIAPRDFIFRSREFEQMEIEYFVHPDQWEEVFENWRKSIHEWTEKIGLPAENVHELEVPEADRAHYSKRTIDFEFDYPFGKKELYGLAYRTDYDLSKHVEHSGAKLEYFDDQTGERFVPHVIEPSLGVDRTVLAILASAYDVDNVGGEERTVLRLAPAVAPVKVAVFPLLKNKPELVDKAKEVFATISNEIDSVAFDDNGNIGKRYRRQDEIGTPLCVTVDFDTLEDDAVTVRDRDTGEQERVKLSDLTEYLSSKLSV